MKKMKMSVGTMAALVFVAVAVSALLISFEMVEAKKDKVKVSFELEFEQNGDDVDVEVKAKGLATSQDFTVRAYSNTDCTMKLTGGEIGTDTTGSGDVDVSGTIPDEVVSDVNSVSIRADSGGAPGEIVVCFLNTTPS